MSHTTLQDLKEKMIFPVSQVSSITFEPSKGNTQVGKIKGKFDQKVFKIFEKSNYDFSNLEKLGLLKDELAGEKIHGLTNLPKPLWISSKKKKEITSFDHTSVEKTKEYKDGKTPRRTLMFERIKDWTHRVSTFERMTRKDERESSK
ncbi:hypothetical protein H5410_040430 [Solanum commersonii]|uniref:Uncharacterized protein n=1 Tax=Solanum commersonii TaxID=4109 RepID=A0A9J5XRD4_SOLCO|nr:hypothetical protein H5410_040430 [Solanum commersonii]